jgi:hypothetical protein
MGGWDTGSDPHAPSGGSPSGNSGGGGYPYYGGGGGYGGPLPRPKRCDYRCEGTQLEN